MAALTVVAAWVLLPGSALILASFLALGGILLPLLCAAAARRAARRQAPARSELTAELVEVLEGSAEIAAGGREADWARRVERAEAELLAIQRTDAWVAGLAAGAGALLAGGAAAAVAAVAVPAVDSGALDGVLLAALVLLALGSFEAVAPLPEAARHLHASARAAERLEEITGGEPAVPDPVEPRPLPGGSELAVEGAAVRYADDGPWALGGVDLLLRPGARAGRGASEPTTAGLTHAASVPGRFYSPSRASASALRCSSSSSRSTGMSPGRCPCSSSSAWRKARYGER